MKNQNGVTLIALIVTVLILLILTVTSVTLVMRWNIISHAENAANAYRNDANYEDNFLNEAENAMNNIVEKYTTGG